jgi:hypothetical protein
VLARDDGGDARVKKSRAVSSRRRSESRHPPLLPPAPILCFRLATPRRFGHDCSRCCSC